MIVRTSKILIFSVVILVLVLILTVCNALFFFDNHLDEDLDNTTFPGSFMFGVSTSSYQIEGAWNEDGKGEGLQDQFYHSSAFTENGDVACDSYHKWAEDVEIVKQLGVQFYRLSISWPRILPNGTINYINEAGVSYYLNIVKALKENKIEPLLTMYHWDMPIHIHELGGFLNPQFVDYFGDYARLLFRLFGEYVTYWITFNEPLNICAAGYGDTFLQPLGLHFAPGLFLSADGLYQCSYVLLKAHAQAYKIYKEEFRSKQKGKISVAPHCFWYEPLTNSYEDSQAAKRGLEFDCGWFLNPIYKGNWPKIMIDRIANRSKLEGFARSRLPTFTENEISEINGTHDYFAFNHYSGIPTNYVTDAPIGEPHYFNDRSISADFSNITALRDPINFRKILNYLKNEYNPTEIIITENGIVEEDMNDTLRITYIHDVLTTLLETIKRDKVDLIGYGVWTLMDNFEWGTYSAKMGLIHVDFDSPNRTRAWRQSAKWYQEVISTRSLNVTSKYVS